MDIVQALANLVVAVAQSLDALLRQGGVVALFVILIVWRWVRRGRL